MLNRISQHVDRRWLAGSLLLTTAVLAVTALLPEAGGTYAQLPCDDPPFDVSRLAAVWDKTDFCTYEEGVYDEIISGGVPRDGFEDMLDLKRILGLLVDGSDQRQHQAHHHDRCQPVATGFHHASAGFPRASFSCCCDDPKTTAVNVGRE